MRMAILAVVFLACSSTFAAADQLPLKEGRYARPEFPCDTAPMGARDVIVNGSPIYSPQFGECKTQIVKRAKNVYVVTAHCSQDNPPVITYRILSRTRFRTQSKYGQGQMRWCSNL